jgi:hypothetical protein
VVGGPLVDSVVEGEGAVNDALGRELAALAHDVERGGVDGGRHGRVDQFDGGEDGDARLLDAEGVGDVDGVEDDGGLALEGGCDVHRAVGDEEELVAAGVLDDVDVAHDGAGAEAVVAVEHGAEEVVGVEVSFHEDIGVAAPHDGAGGGCGSHGVALVHDGHLAELDAVLFGHGADVHLVADEGGPHEAVGDGLADGFEHGVVLCDRDDQVLDGVVSDSFFHLGE